MDTERLARLRVFVAARLPADYQSIQADIQALLAAYDAAAVALSEIKWHGSGWQYE